MVLLERRHSRTTPEGTSAFETIFQVLSSLFEHNLCVNFFLLATKNVEQRSFLMHERLNLVLIGYALESLERGIKNALNGEKNGK